MSNFGKLKIFTKEHKQKISESKNGQKHIQESKNKIRESKKGKKRGPYKRK